MPLASRRLMSLLALLLPSVTAFPALGQGFSAGSHTPEEMIVLHSIGGFGDVGKTDTVTDNLAPGNTLGFCVRFEFQDHPGEPTFWSVRQGVPWAGQPPADYDTFSCDLYVESAQKANLAFLVMESDDDRWICWARPLEEVEKGRWIHIETPRDKMGPWFMGNGKGEWDRVNAIAIEPSGGQATFRVDNMCLLGPGGKRLDIFTTADDGCPVDPSWNEPMREPTEGTVYFPGLSRRNLLEAGTPARFRELLGTLGTDAMGAPLVRELSGAGVVPMFYGQYAAGFDRFLTRRQAWEVNAAGESPNWIPRSVKWMCDVHCLAYGHPAVTEVGRQRVDALAASGIPSLWLVDYTFPWADGPHGYAPASIAAYRADLAGTDEGLHVVADGVESVMRFADYFRGYSGFDLTPAHLGLDDFAQFTPPQPGEEGPCSRARWEVFLYLRSWEWLKLPDRTGRYLQSRGGHGCWIVPNPEDTWGSSDYVHLLRSKGTRNLFPEWFGPAGYLCEGAYAGIPYLRREADRSGARLSVLFETGAGGHAAPYWDWRLAYTTSYLLTAVSRGQDLDNDFLDEATFEHQSDPANWSQFVRFRDGVSKARAFLQARAEQPVRFGARILCVSARPPAQASGSPVYGVGGTYSLAAPLSRAQLLFDNCDSLDLEQVLPDYRMIAYSPLSPRAGDLERLAGWLRARPGRVLVTHSFVPTRDATEFWGMERSSALGAADGGSLLGLGHITPSPGASRACHVTTVAPEAGNFFTPGEAFELPSELVLAPGAEVVVDTDQGPLVSRARVGGSTVYFLHYAAHDPAREPALSIARRVMLLAADEIGEPALCETDPETLVQVFSVGDGISLAAWDEPTQRTWDWRYEPGIPIMQYDRPGVDHQVALPTTGDAPVLVYDFWNDDLRTVRPEGGRVTLTLRDRSCALWYMGPDTPAFRATLASAQATRAWLRDRQFDLTASPASP